MMVVGRAEDFFEKKLNEFTKFKCESDFISLYHHHCTIIIEIVYQLNRRRDPKCSHHHLSPQTQSLTFCYQTLFHLKMYRISHD